MSVKRCLDAIVAERKGSRRAGSVCDAGATGLDAVGDSARSRSSSGGADAPRVREAARKGLRCVAHSSAVDPIEPISPTRASDELALIDPRGCGGAPLARSPQPWPGAIRAASSAHSRNETSAPANATGGVREPHGDRLTRLREAHGLGVQTLAALLHDEPPLRPPDRPEGLACSVLLQVDEREVPGPRSAGPRSSRESAGRREMIDDGHSASPA